MTTFPLNTFIQGTDQGTYYFKDITTISSSKSEFARMQFVHTIFISLFLGMQRLYSVLIEEDEQYINEFNLYYIILVYISIYNISIRVMWTVFNWQALFFQYATSEFFTT